MILRIRPFAVMATMIGLAWTSAWSRPVSGATLTWNGTTGNASQTAKWSPSQLPGVSDDLFYPGATTFTITFDGTVPTVNSQTFRNTANATLSLTVPHSVTTTLDVGTISGDSPSMHLGTGALTVGGTVTLGDVSGSSGTVTIDGDDATLTISGAASDFIAGRAGVGDVTVSGGGVITVGDDFIVGSLSTGSGDVTVTGGSGSLPFLNISTIETTSAVGGDIIVGNNGSGDLHLLGGGLAHSAHDVRIATTNGASGTVDLSGSFSFLSSRLASDRNIDVARNDSILSAGTAVITINSPGIVSAVNAVRIGDADGGTGTVTLASGTLGAANVDIQTNGNLTGTGTVNADISNLGDITPSGASGLTINGILSNTTSNRITGTKIHFGAGGGYTGSGTCQVDITGDATSTITATGTLSIGDNTTSGFSYLGTLNIGGNIVTLLDSNGAVLGGLTSFNSGRLECSAGIGIQNGATLQGDGLVVSTVTDSGVLDPHTAGSLGGLITIQGNLLMNPTGIVDMEIGGAPAGSNNDRINVSGTATFDGTMRVKLKNGYIPHVGEQFIAVNATAGRTGTFAAIVPPSPTPCNNVTFVLVYSSTAAIVLVRPPLGCTALGDLNSNGGCDGQDIQLFVDSLVSGPYNACADMNGDCLNDLADIPIFLNCLL